jgi:hypothetical protein
MNVGSSYAVLYKHPPIHPNAHHECNHDATDKPDSLILSFNPYVDVESTS